MPPTKANSYADESNRISPYICLNKAAKQAAQDAYKAKPCKTCVKQLFWQFLTLLDGGRLNNILLVLLQKLLIVCATVLRHKLRGLGGLRSKLVQPRRHLPTKKRPRHTEKQSFHQTAIWRTTYRSCTRYRRRPNDDVLNNPCQKQSTTLLSQDLEESPEG